MRALTRRLFLLMLPGPAFRRQAVELPLIDGSTRFAALGDTGTGQSSQYDVGEQLCRFRETVGFNLVLMLGDNIYGDSDTADMRAKFELPYAKLLAAGVQFYATLGSHDNAKRQLRYRPFHLQGRRYYSFDRANIRFIVLDSNNLDRSQQSWLQRLLAATPGDRWKIVYFHHPLYTSGREHGQGYYLKLRSKLHPLFRQYGVDVVLSGHEHEYERVTPVDGIQYFVSGAGGELSRNFGPTGISAAWFNGSQHFMLMEVASDTLYFQTVAKDGSTVDVGAIAR